MAGDDTAGTTDDLKRPAEPTPISIAARRSQRGKHQHRRLKTLSGRIWRLELALAELRAVEERVQRRLRTLLTSRARLEGSITPSIDADAARRHVSLDRPLTDAPADAAPSEHHWQPLPPSDQQQRMRHRVTIQLGSSQVHALLSSGVLTPAEITNPDKIGAVVQVLLDHWCHRIDVPTDGERNAVDARDRRAGADRRCRQPNPDSLLGRIAGTVFDRRVGGDRRRTVRSEDGGATGADDDEPAVGGQAEPVKKRQRRAGARRRDAQTGAKPAARRQRSETATNPVVVLWPKNGERERRQILNAARQARETMLAERPASNEPSSDDAHNSPAAETQATTDGHPPKPTSEPR